MLPGMKGRGRRVGGAINKNKGHNCNQRNFVLDKLSFCIRLADGERNCFAD